MTQSRPKSLSTTLNRITGTAADQCTKFHAAVFALNGYNVQGVHCFDCTIADWVYRVYNGSHCFSIRLLGEVPA